MRPSHSKRERCGSCVYEVTEMGLGSAGKSKQQVYLPRRYLQNINPTPRIACIKRSPSFTAQRWGVPAVSALEKSLLVKVKDAQHPGPLTEEGHEFFHPCLLRPTLKERGRRLMEFGRQAKQRKKRKEGEQLLSIPAALWPFRIIQLKPFL